jgi:hypothetical protein
MADLIAAALSRLATINPQQQGKGHTLLQFPLRFDGQSPEVETFVSALRLYARDLGVPEVTALGSLALLLTGVAAQWWFGAKKDFSSWEEALAGLEETFTIRKPPYELYRELFSREQGPMEPTHSFVFRCRALLAQIPENKSEKVQLDMVYGLLHRRVRTRIARSDVESFNQLLSRAREVEPSVFSTALPSQLLPQRSVEPRQQPRPQCRKGQDLEIRQVSQTDCYTLAIREEEGPKLTSSQRSHVDKPLSAQKDCFAPGGEASDYLEFYTNVPSHHPPSTPPYRIPPRRKEGLRKKHLADKNVAKIPTTFDESAPGKCHLSDLTLFTGHHRMTPEPIHLFRRRGHHRKKLSEAGPSPRTMGQTRGGEYNS